MNDRIDLNALTMRVIDLEQWRRRVDQTSLPPCPWWCASTDLGHHSEYDSQAIDDASTLYRNHSRAFGSVSVVQAEANRNGRLTFEPVKISVYDDAPETAETARQVARDLQSAAELVDRIEQKAGA